MKLTEFIKEFGIQGLQDQFAIEVRQYPEQDLYCLNYSQIDSPRFHEIADVCRGVIVDSIGNVYCYPFTRFYNFGEGNTKDFDFANCTVFEKADGSLCKVWFNLKSNRWEIGTRGTAFAEANHAFGTKTDWTFREAILDAMGFTETQFQDCMNGIVFHRTCTYIMEYCSPWNRIVTKYEKPEMVLLGVRSNITGIESGESGLTVWWERLSDRGMNIRLPEKYFATSAEQVVKLVEGMTDLKEGVVVRNNITGQRIKVKSSLYVKVHTLRGNGVPSQNNLMEMVLTGEKDEFLVHFPEYAGFFDPVEEALAHLQNDATSLYETNKHIESQKEFALAINGFNPKVSPILFKARKDKLSAHEAYVAMDLNQRMKLLEKYL